MVFFRSYQDSDYELICDFLIELNRTSKDYINWNWARFEWMMFHPDFRPEHKNLIRLWFDDDKLVALAIFDMYPGEGTCLTLKEYEYLYPEVVDYACQYLSDDKGLDLIVNDKDTYRLGILKSKGFVPCDNYHEYNMALPLDKEFDDSLPKGFCFKEVDPVIDSYEFQWVLFQGFDHGNDKEEFKKSLMEIPANRPHFNKSLSLSVVNEKGEMIAYSSLWYNPKTDYAYLEPLCVIPEYRHQGIGKQLVYRLCNIVRKMNAKRVYVLSENKFYSRIGFIKDEQYTFYHKNKEIIANGKTYIIHKLLGKGKGGYSYLGEIDNHLVVVKAIHHEPCSYYQFGNKIEAERNDYQRLLNTGIRIPRMIDIDLEREIIIKEFIDGQTISELINNNEPISQYIPQVKEMEFLVRKVNLNIDYYPTNFVVNNGLLYYIDYECNEYHDEWNFDNWGIKHWLKS